MSSMSSDTTRAATPEKESILERAFGETNSRARHLGDELDMLEERLRHALVPEESLPPEARLEPKGVEDAPSSNAVHMVRDLGDRFDVLIRRVALLSRRVDL